MRYTIPYFQKIQGIDDNKHFNKVLKNILTFFQIAQKNVAIRDTKTVNTKKYQLFDLSKDIEDNIILHVTYFEAETR